ncbi:MAG: Na/Pi cotransporter family protein [Bacteroidales bacterium]|nr:Na/Pi cotransporter family protein [Bacteroidales bacterium]MDY0253611.1 Na/Pi cotransporter family protein [Tenuifilaceae bacterium]
MHRLIAAIAFLLITLLGQANERDSSALLSKETISYRIERLGKGLNPKLSGNNQYQVAEKKLGKPFAVRVTDSLYRPKANVRVYFEVIQAPDDAEGFAVEPLYSRTDSLGEAHCWLTLGTEPGEYQVAAKIQTENLESFVIFTAYARKQNWVLMLSVGLLGGLALFLMGINLMSTGFRHSAGEKIRSVLGTLTQNRIYSTGFGAFITMVTQSSSATTVMLVGFVQSGLLKFRQTIGMIFGAAIGTTITVQLIAFRIADYSLLLVALGFALNTFGKKEGVRFAGEAILGFGILFFGMHLMSEAMYPLRTFEPFIDLLSKLQKPILGIIAGTIFTALIQSSAAFIGIMLTLATQGLLSLEAAIPLLLGANLGTSITGIIASITSSREAQKVAMAYTIFKLVGVLVLVWFIDPFAQLVRRITPDTIAIGANVAAENTPRLIANAHTIFNVLLTLVVLPFTNVYARFIDWLMPPRPPKSPTFSTKFIDKNLLSTPAVALKLAKQEVIRLSEIVDRMVKDIITPFVAKDKSTLSRIERDEVKVDYLRDQINAYLLDLTRQDVTDQSIQEAFQIMYAVKELEQIADIVSKNLLERARWWLQVDHEFSPEGKKELLEFHQLTQKQLKRAKAVFSDLNLEKAQKMAQKYQEYKDFGRELERQHFSRLKEEVNKSVTSSKTHLELVSMFRTIGSHANNVAQIILEWPSGDKN